MRNKKQRHYYSREHLALAAAATAALLLLASKTASAFTSINSIHRQFFRRSGMLRPSSSKCNAPPLKSTSWSDDATNGGNNSNALSPSSVTATATTEEMKMIATKLIMTAAKLHGATDEMISIDWKWNEKIVVTVDVSAGDGAGGLGVLGELLDYEEDIMDDEREYDDEFDNDDDMMYATDEDEEILFDDDFEEEDFESIGLPENEDDEQQQQQSSQRKLIDLTQIARTINEYLSQDGEDSLSYKIAQLHEIEVTTPEFDNVLRSTIGGVNMFEVYKGFDVIVDYWDVPKKKKKKKSNNNKSNYDSDEEEEEEQTKMKKVIEGKLVGRDEEKGVTMINVKGRIVKVKNDVIEFVKLPKAKREKKGS